MGWIVKVKPNTVVSREQPRMEKKKYLPSRRRLRRRRRLTEVSWRQPPREHGSIFSTRTRRRKSRSSVGNACGLASLSVARRASSPARWAGPSAPGRARALPEPAAGLVRLEGEQVQRLDAPRRGQSGRRWRHRRRSGSCGPRRDGA